MARIVARRRRRRIPCAPASMILAACVVFITLYLAVQLITFRHDDSSLPSIRGGSSSGSSSAGLETRLVSPSHQQVDERLLSADPSVTVTASVRGNLGPPSVIVHNGTDWLHDRWQAASNMHGVAIPGQQWVQLDFWGASATPLSSSGWYIDKIVLDWEAAYCDDYELIVVSPHGESTVVLDSKRSPERIGVRKFGQSPGVKAPTPLHVVHTIENLQVNNAVKLRIVMRSSAMGWGISLWKVDVYGYR